MSDMRYVRLDRTEQQANLLDKHPVSDGRGEVVPPGIAFGGAFVSAEWGERAETLGDPNPRKGDHRPSNYLPQ